MQPARRDEDHGFTFTYYLAGFLCFDADFLPFLLLKLFISLSSARLRRLGVWGEVQIGCLSGLQATYIIIQFFSMSIALEARLMLPHLHDETVEWSR